MKTNLLIAIAHIVKNPVTNLVSHYRSSNRVNSMGDALELYIKDVFCDSLSVIDVAKKNEMYSEYFSYTGSQNSPPDIMIRGGDAIEVKKIENINAGIALNSSYPKDKLYADSPMIIPACRNCEEWREKDLVYAVGVSKDEVLKALWFVYGDCYSANKEVYEKVRSRIAEGVNELRDVEFSETKELARVNKVDPLGITYLRIRGIWGIESPLKVFGYIAPMERDSDFFMHAILLQEKYLSFPEEDRRNLESLVNENFVIKDIKIKSPNNPMQLLEAKLLSFKK